MTAEIVQPADGGEHRAILNGSESALFITVNMDSVMGSNFNRNGPHNIKISVAGNNNTIYVDGV